MVVELYIEDRCRKVWIKDDIREGTKRQEDTRFAEKQLNDIIMACKIDWGDIGLEEKEYKFFIRIRSRMNFETVVSDYQQDAFNKECDNRIINKVANKYKTVK